MWRKKPSKASKKCQYNSPSKIAFRPPSRAAQLRRLTKIYCHQKRLFLLCGQLHKMGLFLTLIRRRCFVNMKCTQCNAHLKAKPICRGRPKNRTVAHWIFSHVKRYSLLKIFRQQDHIFKHQNQIYTACPHIPSW